MALLARFERWRVNRLMARQESQLEMEGAAAETALTLAGIGHSDREFRAVHGPDGLIRIVSLSTGATVQIHADPRRAMRLCAQINYLWHIAGRRPALDPDNLPEEYLP